MFNLLIPNCATSHVLLPPLDSPILIGVYQRTSTTLSVGSKSLTWFGSVPLSWLVTVLTSLSATEDGLVPYVPFTTRFRHTGVYTAPH